MLTGQQRHQTNVPKQAASPPAPWCPGTCYLVGNGQVTTPNRKQRTDGLRGVRKSWRGPITKDAASSCQRTSSYLIRVCFGGDWFRVAIGVPSPSVRSLGSTALQRYYRASNLEKGPGESEFGMRRCRSGELLDHDDSAAAVLDHNDFVQLVLADEDDKISASLLATTVHPYQEPTKLISLDGNGLTTSDLVALGQGLYKIKLTPEAVDRVNKSRAVIEGFTTEGKVVYGVNTGFGKFAHTRIPAEQLVQLQENLVRSHSAGVGPPLSVERTRMLLAQRINVLAKGYSGISMETLDAMIKAFNASCLSWVPEKGTLGASGDLAPLAHLALGLMGEGRMWSPQSGWADAEAVLKGNGLKPLVLKPKEGIAAINGTQLISSLGAEAVERALGVARQADVVAALSLEALRGSARPFHHAIHAVRPHPGQIEVAERICALLDSPIFPSQISESHRSCNRVQDAYTLRCIPQVHGIVNDTIKFVRMIITTEMNSATDNPLVFAESGETLSCGNFHGEYPAKALDYLAIGVHELASFSERRIERLVNPALSELPAFLVKDGGLNSGFMIAHCTAAALVSESKALCHPASVDSLSTSAATEDHVSMGGWAARKALRVVEHVEQVLAIELLAACQALEFLRPLKTTAPLQRVYQLVRSVVSAWDKDRIMSPDIEAAHTLLRQQKVWAEIQPYMDEYRNKMQA
ncbi:histidine ammonia-lyase-like isoform X2 [Phycodurus eques]|uniref:histidine ammonia-lyase-like isoform X2 n=1 Tax=Phycodurus eques TaxID=693459 RepID=UPI002ACED2C9|nr:histidine ammonia-lyase-like isoform X2 [Phycodurus eques]